MKVLVFLVCVLAITCKLLSIPVYGTSPIDVSKSEKIQLAGKIDYLEDQSHDLKIEDIPSQNTQMLFKLLDNNKDSFGVSGSIWWFKMDFDFSKIPNQARLLIIDNPLIWDARLYLDNKSQMKEVHHGGFAFPADQRPFFDSRLIFPIKHQAGKATYYLRIHNKGSLQLNLSLYRPETLVSTRNMVNWIMGIYFGLLFSMAIYNFFIGLSTKDKAYFYYVGYLVMLSLMIALNEGYGQLLLFPNSPYVSYASINWAAAGIIIFASQFARQFLDTRLNVPLIDIWLRANIILSIIFIFISFALGGVATANSILFLSLIFLVSMLTAGFTCLGKKVPAARYFVIAWILMLVGGLLTVFAKLGIIPTVVFTEYGLQLGSAVEAMLLSFALAAKINRLQLERNEAETKAREALEKSNHRLQQSQKIKDEFFSLLSHELRTPIHGLRGGIDLLTTGELSDEQAENVDMLNQSTDEMLNYVDHLLVLSQFKSDKLVLDKSPFKLRLLTDKLGARFSSLANEKNIPFLFNSLEKEEQEVYGDLRVLSVVIYQLLYDLFDKPAVGVDLQVKYYDKNETHNEKLTKKEGNEEENINIIHSPYLSLVLCIRNKLDSESNPDIDRFEEVKTKNDSSYDAVSARIGTQYGSHQSDILRINKKLQQQLAKIVGAQIETLKLDESHTQTELRISLSPNYSELRETSDISTRVANNSKATHLKKNKQKLKALIVDDSDINRLVAEKYLDKFGFEYLHAKNGEEAVSTLKDDPNIDFVLMDCHMPILNGFQATEQIRADNEIAEIPIIAITADVTHESALACYSSGMNQVLHKPLSIKDLEKSLRELKLLPE